MSRSQYLVQIDDGPASIEKNDLHLRPLNVEKGKERFPERDLGSAPQALSWRSNLAALSQRRNLLFVAYEHQIYVWEPAAPRQVLGSKPVMIITPVMKQPDAEGYISPRLPHGINNILVDDLGRDEILLLATDSGNICAYHVENIFSCIESAKMRGQKFPILEARIDPFFCENVGSSAWGLAVHKFARLIAVAANTKTITVFAFALAEADSESDDDTAHLWSGPSVEFEQNWIHIQDEYDFAKLHELYRVNRHRTCNLKISYRGHYTNIPSVSFLSSDLDSDGLWMVSTDIDNKLLLWTIWDKFHPVRVLDFRDGEPLPDVLRKDERGWSVLALDPRSFRKYQSYFDACGGKVLCWPSQSGDAVLDVSVLACGLPDASSVFIPALPTANDSPEPVLPDIFDRYSRIRSDSSSISSEDNLSVSSSITTQSSEGEESLEAISENQEITENTPGQPSTQRAEWFINDRNLESLMRSSLDGLSLLQSIIDGAPPQVFINNEDVDMISAESDGVNDSADDDASVDSGVVYRDASNPHDPRYSNSLLELTPSDTDLNRGKSYSSSEHLCSNFPILHFSETNIRLLQSSFAKHPNVISGRPLRQRLPSTLWSLSSYDRFNMVKYVPEAGIVIAATQKGRAAVITLTQVDNGNYALRINWIIPFASQERSGERPPACLLGIAVSPMQGFEEQPDIVHVPHAVTSHDDFSFHYRAHDSASLDTEGDWQWQGGSEMDSEKRDEDVASSSSSSSSEHAQEMSFAESHGTAKWNYRPKETWHGIMSSRHYRVMLMYADHTVMSYEFWFDWTDIAAGCLSRSPQEETAERLESSHDDYLVL